MREFPISLAVSSQRAPDRKRAAQRERILAMAADGRSYGEIERAESLNAGQILHSAYEGLADCSPQDWPRLKRLEIAWLERQIESYTQRVAAGTFRYVVPMLKLMDRLDVSRRRAALHAQTGAGQLDALIQRMRAPPQRSQRAKPVSENSPNRKKSRKLAKRRRNH